MPKIEISVVTSTYYSSGHIAAFVEHVSKELQSLTSNYEIVIVDDGSTDTTQDILRDIVKNSNIPLRCVFLSRNFGQHKALMTGLKASKGDFVFMMDSDLEEKPELISYFWKLHQSDLSEVDVIYGFQKNRKGISGLLSKWFYLLFKYLSRLKIEMNPTPFRLMSRRYVNALILFKEHEFFFLGISVLAGFIQKGTPIEKGVKGHTSYSFQKRFKQALEAITSFSNRPLYVVFYLGLFMILASLIYSLIVLFQKLIGFVGEDGWSSLIISIWLVGGLMTFSIGIVGIYISKVFTESKNRPFSIIKEEISNVD